MQLKVSHLKHLSWLLQMTASSLCFALTVHHVFLFSFSYCTTMGVDDCNIVVPSGKLT